MENNDLKIPPFSKVKEEIKEFTKLTKGSINHVCINILHAGGNAIYYRFMSRESWDDMTDGEMRAAKEFIKYMKEDGANLVKEKRNQIKATKQEIADLLISELKE